MIKFSEIISVNLQPSDIIGNQLRISRKRTQFPDINISYAPLAESSTNQTLIALRALNIKLYILGALQINVNLNL